MLRTTTLAIIVAVVTCLLSQLLVIGFCAQCCRIIQQ